MPAPSNVLGRIDQETLDHLPVAVLVCAVPSGAVLICNRKAVELCGRSPDAREPLWTFARWTEDDNGPGDRGGRLQAALGSGGAGTFAGTLASDARRVAVSLSLQPLLDDAGRPVAAVAVFQTSAQAASGQDDTEARLGRSEQRLQLALQAGRLGLWEFDPRTRALDASAQCKANHGRTADARFEYDDLLNDIDPDHRGRFDAAVQQALATAGGFEVEVPNRWPDGTRHRLFVAGRVIDARSMVGVSMDVTEQRRAEEMLRDADRRKDEFLALLGHELRTPLSPIVAAARVLELLPLPDPRLAQARDVIARQVKQMTKLVDDLLDVGRITSGKLLIEKQRVGLNAIVAQAIETCRPAIDQRHHTLAATYTTDRVEIDADPVRIVQVVSNLLTNAAKYMSPGGHIELTTASEDGQAVLRVRDHGVGIAPEMLTRVFERFVQVDTSRTRSQGGLGIGLSVVKSLVELHGGTVEARSEGLGRGSEFSVRLPLAIADAAPRTAAPPMPPPR